MGCNGREESLNAAYVLKQDFFLDFKWRTLQASHKAWEMSEAFGVQQGL